MTTTVSSPEYDKSSVRVVSHVSTCDARCHCATEDRSPWPTVIDTCHSSGSQFVLLLLASVTRYSSAALPPWRPAADNSCLTDIAIQAVTIPRLGCMDRGGFQGAGGK